MKIFRAAQVQEIDAYTIENEPVASEDLMERAALRLTSWYVRRFHINQKVVLFAGPGNNGGDALAMARLLADRQFKVECYLLEFGKMSADCILNKKRLLEQDMVRFFELGKDDLLPSISKEDVLVDGIFGSGLTRPVSGFPARVIDHINQQDCDVIAIDIPSGLRGEDNAETIPGTVVRANFTLSFQFPFLSFFFSENNIYVGQWHILDIRLHPAAIRTTDTPYHTLVKEDVRGMLPQRDKFAHKGTFGHGLIISGSYGMMGAALLAGEACLRAGAGLTTLHIPRFGYNIIQTALPEALVSLDQSDILFSQAPGLEAFTAIGIGPGLGTKPNTARGLKMLLEKAGVALVIDADGLNILSEHPEWMDLLPEGSILTPHPKEFDRLFGDSPNAYERHLKQRELAKKAGIVIVLKGAYTGIAGPDGSYFFNTTGNPGMATGGSGDVLTGLITGLLAQGMTAMEAALAGVYLHGLAGDLGAEKSSEEALIAGDILKYIGPAFSFLKA